MALNGLAGIVYGVDDVDESMRFLEDFGLKPPLSGASRGRFQLPDGANVIVRPLADVVPDGSALRGVGVQEIIFGVDTAESFAEIEQDLSTDRPVRKDEDGVIHFLSDCGIPLGLALFEKSATVGVHDDVNSPNKWGRINRQRRWRKRAYPKRIQHVGLTVVDPLRSADFFLKRLGFRLSDYQPGLGLYLRCSGTNDHHNLFLFKAQDGTLGATPEPGFHHANFGVEDIDEIMVGANYLTKRGWEASDLGLGRHRTDSALFYYIPAPTGGEIEYGADGDVIDDSWIPRYWTSPMFGFCHFVHNLAPFLIDEIPWEVRYLTEEEYVIGGSFKPRDA